MRNEICLEMSWNDYVAIDGLNPSSLVHGLKSMRAYKAALQESGPQTRSQQLGSVVHALVLEPHNFNDRFKVHHGIDARRGNAWLEWRAANPSIDPVHPKVWEEAQRVRDAILDHRRAFSLIDETVHEASLLCEDRGVQCKGRVDGYAAGRLIDLKTTPNIRPDAIGRVFANLHYAEKLSCYVRWLELLQDHMIEEVVIIAAEVKDSYDVTTIDIPRPVIENAWPRMEAVIERVKTCSESNHWPGVGQSVELVLPNWSMEEELDWSS